MAEAQKLSNGFRGEFTDERLSGVWLQNERGSFLQFVETSDSMRTIILIFLSMGSESTMLRTLSEGFSMRLRDSPMSMTTSPPCSRRLLEQVWLRTQFWTNPRTLSTESVRWETREYGLMSLNNYLSQIVDVEWRPGLELSITADASRERETIRILRYKVT